MYFLSEPEEIKINGEVCKIHMELKAVYNIQKFFNVSIFNLPEILQNQKNISKLYEIVTGNKAKELSIIEGFSFATALLKALKKSIEIVEKPQEEITASNDTEYEKVNVMRLVYLGVTVLRINIETVWGMTMGDILSLYYQHQLYMGMIESPKSIDDVIPF